MENGKRDKVYRGNDDGSIDGERRLLVAKTLHTKYVWIRRNHGGAATIDMKNDTSRSKVLCR